jgi:hypothetical protein
MSRLLTIIGPSSGFEWLKVREQLSRLYRDTGRDADAAAIDGELAQLLAVADEDHPIKRRLARSGLGQAAPRAAGER